MEEMKIEYTKDGVKFGDEFISLDEIIDNVNKAKQKDSDLVLLTMSWSGGRGFDGVVEQIVLPADKVDKIIDTMLDKTIYFGEIAGKHSDIHGPFEDEDYNVSTNPDVITKFLKDNPSGHTCNYSFLDTFSNYALDGAYDDISHEEALEFTKLY